MNGSLTLQPGTSPAAPARPLKPQGGGRLIGRRPGSGGQGRDWTVLSAFLLLFALPALALLFLARDAAPEHVSHFVEVLVWEFLRNSLLVSMATALLATACGAAAAFVCTCFDFRGKKLLIFLLAAPMALPPYILAYAYLQIFEMSPLSFALEGTWQNQFGTSGSLFRSPGGLIFTMSMGLFPYPFLLCRNYLGKVGSGWLTIAGTLGLSRSRAAARIVLPGSLPALCAGGVLALLEAFSDFGAAYLFSVDTLTTGIFKTWHNFFSVESAAFISLFMIMLVIPLTVLEMRLLGDKGYAQGAIGPGRVPRLTGMKGILCLAPFFALGAVAFVLPVSYLAVAVWRGGGPSWIRQIPETIANTAGLGIAGALTTTAVIGLLACWWRISEGLSVSTPFFSRARLLLPGLIHVNYGLPGALVGVGVLGILGWTHSGFGDTVADLPEPLDGWLFPALAGAGLLWALVIRFSATVWKACLGAFKTLPTVLDAAAAVHGRRNGFKIWRLYLPHLRPFLLYAAAIVGIEIMKEMPATLMLRPVGWDTLAVKVFEYTSEGEWVKAAWPSLLIALLGLAGFCLALRWESREAAVAEKAEARQ